MKRKSITMTTGFLFFCIFYISCDASSFQVIKDLSNEDLYEITRAIGHESNIYISQRSARNIIKLDKDGNVEAIIGRKGQGPGEFENIYSFKIYDGQLFVMDDRLRRISVFNLSGDFISSFGVNVTGEISLYNDLIYINNPVSFASDFPDKIMIYDFSGNKIKSILKNDYVGSEINKALFSNLGSIYITGETLLCFAKFQRKIDVYDLNSLEKINSIVWDKDFKVEFPKSTDSRRVSFFSNPAFVSIVQFKNHFYCVYFDTDKNENSTKIATFDNSGQLVKDILIEGIFPYIIVLNNEIHLLSEEFLLIRLMTD